MEIKVAAPSYGYRKRETAGKQIYFNGAIYGDYGSGKTYLSGTIDRVVQKLEMPKIVAPEGIKVVPSTLFCNAEQGEEGLPEDCANIIIKDIYDYEGFSRLYDFLKLHCRFTAAGDTKKLLELQSKYFNIPIAAIQELWIFKAVVIDSLTEVQKYCLYSIMGLSLDSKLDDDIDYIQQRGWGQALEQILLAVRNFRALPIFKIFIIQQVEDTDEKKKLFYRPALQGQAKLSILGFFDFVGYYVMQVTPERTLRRLFLSPVGPFKAKHRFEAFTGHYLDNPTMQDLVKLKLHEETAAAVAAIPSKGPKRPGVK